MPQCNLAIMLSVEWCVMKATAQLSYSKISLTNTSRKELTTSGFDYSLGGCGGE